MASTMVTSRSNSRGCGRTDASSSSRFHAQVSRFFRRKELSGWIFCPIVLAQKEFSQQFWVDDRRAIFRQKGIFRETAATFLQSGGIFWQIAAVLAKGNFPGEFFREKAHIFAKSNISPKDRQKGETLTQKQLRRIVVHKFTCALRLQGKVTRGYLRIWPLVLLAVYRRSPLV